MTTDEHAANTEDGLSATTQLLEIATHSANELLGEAKAEAASIVAAAQATADRARAELDRSRAESEAELDRHRVSVLSGLAERQAELEARIASLEDVEQETRVRTRIFLVEQLDKIEAAVARPSNRLGGTG